ncbi:MAG: HDIG domain-containing protein [Candidatus Bathyarchaeota archaeon]|nr:HDIG domain-containing protein [Candidatus Bathyarchaeota archaeon]
MGCSHHVINHCHNVAKAALRIGHVYELEGYTVDLKLIEAGALLHDMGRSKSHEIDHAAIGGKMAREMGLPDNVVRIIERHVGAGIPDDEAHELGLPEGCYVPDTLEEKIVAYADKIVEGNKVVDIKVYLDALTEKYGSDHPSIKRLLVLHREIISVIGDDF